MASIKVISLISGGLLLGLSLAYIGEADKVAAGEVKTAQSDRAGGGPVIDKQKGGHSFGEKTIEGQVSRMVGMTYFVKMQDGKEVRLFADLTTQQGENIGPGTFIQAKVDDRNHALVILSEAAVTDRRNDKE